MKGPNTLVIDSDRKIESRNWEFLHDSAKHKIMIDSDTSQS